jgi:hypothetical protein
VERLRPYFMEQARMNRASFRSLVNGGTEKKDFQVTTG